MIIFKTIVYHCQKAMCERIRKEKNVKEEASIEKEAKPGGGVQGSS